MTPEKQFLKFCSEHSEEYIKGWFAGLTECLNALAVISKKAEYKDSTSEVS